MEFAKIKRMKSVKGQISGSLSASEHLSVWVRKYRKGIVSVMKYVKRISLMLAVSLIMLLMTSCSSTPDAGVLVREAKSEISNAKSCSASVGNHLTFTVDGTRHVFETKNESIYCADPFALKSSLTSNNDGSSSNSETYTVTENGNIYFYCKTTTGWQKTAVENLDTSPAAQISVLQLLNNVEDQKYVRQTEINSKKVHKIELKLKNEVLSSMIENIVTASGIGSGSETIVPALVDSAPTVYGYCYVDVDTGKLVRLELDATDALNHIFQNIEGNEVQITVQKGDVSGDFSGIDSTPKVELPAEAKDATSVEAAG
jgi:hypothetical protein